MSETDARRVFELESAVRLSFWAERHGSGTGWHARAPRNFHLGTNGKWFPCYIGKRQAIFPTEEEAERVGRGIPWWIPENTASIMASDMPTNLPSTGAPRPLVGGYFAYRPSGAISTTGKAEMDLYVRMDGDA